MGYCRYVDVRKENPSNVIIPPDDKSMCWGTDIQDSYDTGFCLVKSCTMSAENGLHTCERHRNVEELASITADMLEKNENYRKRVAQIKSRLHLPDVDTHIEWYKEDIEWLLKNYRS